MPANKRSTARAWTDPDDAPDLSKPQWKAKLDASPLRRGRPRSDATQISTTIRLDREVVDHFRASGPGWQSRINEALRKWIAA
jgi:uncharacterized protein (DUF4415 family)